MPQDGVHSWGAVLLVLVVYSKLKPCFLRRIGLDRAIQQQCDTVTTVQFTSNEGKLLFGAINQQMCAVLVVKHKSRCIVKVRLECAVVTRLIVCRAGMCCRHCKLHAPLPLWAVWSMCTIADRWLPVITGNQLVTAAWNCLLEHLVTGSLLDVAWTGLGLLGDAVAG
ncbi:hypothetical protein COO60DRAFT_1628868 [Scenedesmus sp. NREL 46B-D3]|nr:hypothetical protein COO60DRAFT_1628868 [Scenedesmus sp. NREL 46B-D3]